MSAISNYLETVLLDLVFNGTSYAGQSTVYVKLHTGDPGEAGTSNAATETTRAAATFGAASSGAIANDAAIEWTNVSTTETVSHISIWDASSAGNCLWKGALSASKSLTAGDNLSIPVGDLDITLD